MRSVKIARINFEIHMFIDSGKEAIKMKGVFDGIIPELPDEINHQNTVAKKKIPIRLLVNSKSVIFDAFQIGERDDNRYFNMKSIVGNMDDVGKRMYGGLEHMHLQQFRLNNGEVAVRMYSYKTPVAQVSVSGGIEIVSMNYSVSTKEHLRTFLRFCSKANTTYTFSDLICNYGVNQLTELGVKPVVFPRITIGMLNKAIREHISECGNTSSNIRVDSNNRVVEVLPNGMKQMWFNTPDLRSAVMNLISSDLISMNQILFANRPDQIQRYFKTKIV